MNGTYGAAPLTAAKRPVDRRQNDVNDVASTAGAPPRVQAAKPDVRIDGRLRALLEEGGFYGGARQVTAAPGETIASEER
jgi:hypothetical protein